VALVVCGASRAGLVQIPAQVDDDRGSRARHPLGEPLDRDQGRSLDIHRREATAEPIRLARRLARVPQPIVRYSLAAGLALLLLASIAGCQAAASVSLEDREFLSNGISDGGAAFNLVPGIRIRLGFMATNLTANAGCNTFGATYRVEGGRLVIDGGAMTEMGCDNGRNQQDQWLFAFLGSKPGVTLAGNDLTLDNGQVIMRLVDRRIAEPDRNIVGPTWTVTSIIAGDAVSSVPAGATASLVFGADGSVEVNDGCNRGRGSWAAEGTGITFHEVVLTKMACEGAAGELETAVLAVINAGTVQASIRANVLTLRAGDQGLQLTAS
jgi:heat shock protein HslJ